MNITTRFKSAFASFFESKAQDQTYQYGAWQNSLSDLFNNASALRIDTNTLYHLYNSVVDIKMAIKRREDNTLKEGFKIVDAKNEDKDPDAQQAFLARSTLDSPTMPFSALKRNWVRNRCIAGNHYLYIQKSPTDQFLGLRSIDPRTMYITADQYGNVQKYTQRMQGYSPIEFKPEQIIHSVLDVSTTNPLLGVSPIESIVWDARTELASQMSNYNFYENSAVPAHLMIIDQNLSPEQTKQLQEQVENRFKGSKNRWKTGIIPFVKDIKTITPSQKDMQYLESRKFYTKKVVVAFGVDATLLGYTEGIQYSNLKVIKREFYESVIRPEEIEFEQMVNNILLPRLGLDKILFRALPSNYDDEKEIRDMARNDKLAGIITANEARALQGYDPHDNELADELMFQGALVDDLAADSAQVTNAVKQLKDMKVKSLENLLD